LLTFFDFLTVDLDLDDFTLVLLATDFLAPTFFAGFFSSA
jgi:hypothetical protein